MLLVRVLVWVLGLDPGLGPCLGPSPCMGPDLGFIWRGVVWTLHGPWNLKKFGEVILVLVVLLLLLVSVGKQSQT